MKLTKQGVRDLNPSKFNGARTRPCRHFYGPLRVVGLEWAYDNLSFMPYQREIYGRACMHCGYSQ